MSQPAARYIQQRTTDCPTCGARKGRPCARLGSAIEEVDRGMHVTPHAARLRAERNLATKETSGHEGKHSGPAEVTTHA